MGIRPHFVERLEELTAGDNGPAAILEIREETPKRQVRFDHEYDLCAKSHPLTSPVGSNLAPFKERSAKRIIWQNRKFNWSVSLPCQPVMSNESGGAVQRERRTL